IRRLIRSVDPGAVAGLLGPGRAEIARLLPDLAPPTQARSETPEGDRSGQGRMFEAFLGVLERQARNGPVALVIEDVQWADEGTRGVLTFLSRTLREAAVLIVLSVRTEGIDAGGPVARWLAELERDSWVERLGM